jgi:hypothetical protein
MTYRDPNRLNYDPNFAHSMAKKTVRVTLGAWDYRRVIDVEISGNTFGLDVIEAACRAIWEDLPTLTDPFTDEDSGVARLVMTRPAEGGEGDPDTLTIDDEDERGDEWIADMVVAAEVIAIVPEDRKRTVPKCPIPDEDESEEEQRQ